MFSNKFENRRSMHKFFDRQLIKIDKAVKDPRYMAILDGFIPETVNVKMDLTKAILDHAGIYAFWINFQYVKYIQQGTVFVSPVSEWLDTYYKEAHETKNDCVKEIMMERSPHNSSDNENYWNNLLEKDTNKYQIKQIPLYIGHAENVYKAVEQHKRISKSSFTYSLRLSSRKAFYKLPIQVGTYYTSEINDWKTINPKITRMLVEHHRPLLVD